MESMPSTTEFAVGAAACFVAVVLLHLVLHQRISAALSSTQKAAEQMIKGTDGERKAGLVVITNAASAGELGVLLVQQLKEAGFSHVLALGDKIESDDLKGASLVVHLAPTAASAAAGAAAIVTQCQAQPGCALLLVSDAAAGCDPQHDVADGDLVMQPPDGGHSCARLRDLLAAEKAVAQLSSTGRRAAVVRVHRLIGGVPPSFATHALFSGAALLIAGARAYTSLTTPPVAAAAVAAAAKDLAAGSDVAPVQVVTNGDVFSAAYLLRASCAMLRAAPPMLPFSSIFAPKALCDHQYFFPSTQAASAKGADEVALVLSQRQKAIGFIPRLIWPMQVACIAFLIGAVGPSFVSPAAAATATAAAAAAAAIALLYVLVPPPRALKPQPPLSPVCASGGVPLLGHALDFVKGPVYMVTKLRARYRGMFTVRIATQRITFMIGPEAQRSFIKATDKELDQSAVYKFTIPVFGPGIVYDSSLDERLQQVKMLVHSMNTASLQAMVPKMVSEAEAYFASKWGEAGEADLRETFAELIILTASSTLMGPEVRGELFEDVARIYHDLDNGLTPFSVFFPRAPTKAHRKRDAARKEMVNIFSKVIKSRRERTAKEKDFLQTMIDFRYKDVVDKKTGKLIKAGVGFTDEEIVGLLIVLLFAGQHTSSITSTWLGAMLLSNAEAMADVKAEQAEVFADDSTLTYDSLVKLEKMRRAISETLRLYPPLILLIRKALVDRAVGAFTIPKGDVVMVCMPAANKDPAHWSEPEAFRPERFAPGGAEADTWSSRTVEHGANSGQMLSFGGGHHMCTGRRFGFLQVIQRALASVNPFVLRPRNLGMSAASRARAQPPTSCGAARLIASSRSPLTNLRACPPRLLWELRDTPPTIDTASPSILARAHTCA